jgi:phenylpropionate dioxygenase-like ring-hydroxylating dioxygenase large terminal subunit
MSGDPLTALAADADRARALPRECYIDPAFFEKERERVLRPGWHAVAHTSQLPVPGDYHSLELFGVPIVVVRDEAGRLRAFSRVCLHRAFPFVEGDGNTKRFSCPYHRWSYDLQGRLCAAPFMEVVPDFDRGGERLPELALEEWQGFAFVSLDPAPAPLAAQLGPLEALLGPAGFGDLVVAETLEFESPWNWKVLVDNFIESYHHMGPHAETLNPTNPAEGTHWLDLDAPVAMIENPAVEGAQPFWAGVVFPTFLFACFRGGAAVGSWYEMQIDAHDHFTLRIHLLLPKALADNREATAFATESVRRVHHEDIEMCDGVQKGLQSPLWKPGRLATQEHALWRFHQLLAEGLAD